MGAVNDLLSRLSAALSDRYAVEKQLGAGGMATVYLAHDIKHDRKVAIKVLRPELAAVLGADRFIQEIKTTATLQHPHILPLFDSGEADGFLYYVMPYIEGETLRDRLNRETQLGVNDAVRIACEVADALDYAHRHGVIHRDIKPENILLHDGRPMVADFGIALAVSAAAGGRMTETGLSLGTPHYMSPEQATADRDLTNRADIYSLGAVLYETLSGEPPHTGSTAQQIVMKIVTDDARPVTDLRKSVPQHVAAALRKSLEKLPADRFESAAKFAEALTDSRFTLQPATATTTAHVPALPSAAALRAGWMWILPLMAVSAVVGWLIRPAGQPAFRDVTRFTVPVPEGHDLRAYRANLAVSHDGRTLAYFAGDGLVKRDFAHPDSELLARVMGLHPVFSRDDRWILFYNDGLRGVPTAGGPAVDFSNRVTDEMLVRDALESSGIFRRAAGDTAWVEVTTLDTAGAEGAHVFPQLLADGKLVLYTILRPGMMWNGAQIVVEEVATGTRTVVVTDGTSGRYVPTGHVVYIRANGNLEAVPFDLKRRRVTGSAFVVVEGVRTGYWAGAGSFTVSDAGTLAFVRGSSWENHRLTWVDRSGRVLGHVGPPLTVEGIRLSPDERYAVTYVASPNADIARFDVLSGEQRRLTFDQTTEDNPVWSPDGRRVAYRKVVTGRDHRILIRPVDGSEDVEEVYTSEHFAVPRSWSPDGGAFVVYDGGAVLIVNRADGRFDTLTTAPGQFGEGRFSPDGRWIAYTSTETGRQEVYVVSYPALAGKQQISVQGGRLPEWSARSGELFFVNQDTLLVSSVATQGGFDWTTPRPLFVSPDLPSIVVGFAVTGDGQRILYPAPNPDAPARQIHVVLNWFEELKARAGN